AFENAAAKLRDLGLHAGMTPLDARLAPFLAWLADQVAVMETSDEELPGTFRRFEAVLVTARLVAIMGYAPPAVSRCLSARLDTLYELAETGNHDIYIDQDTFGDYPNNSFRKKPLVDPQLNGQLPSIHDIYALAYAPTDMLNTANRDKIDAVINYVMHPDYQALRDGYGVMRAGPRRYYAIGWSVHLPGYDGDFELERTPTATLVQRLELMAHFPTARRHRWFGEALAHLETFREEVAGDITVYRFPPSYLRESAGGYWVTGAYMRLEDNRRRPIALTLDSTFRMAYLQHLLRSTTPGAPHL
ncbi:MAG: hypothetical protein ACP5JG_14785, partial [Anaerolineae bacterium]